MKSISRNILMGAALVTILNFNSCKKYEDGPGFTLKSAKGRLVGEWEVVKMTDSDGFSYLDSDYDLELEFDKDGDFSFTTAYSYGGSSYSYSYNGEWEFSSDKEEIEVEISGEKIDWKIKKLTNKELWFEDEEGTEWELEAI